MKFFIPWTIAKCSCIGLVGALAGGCGGEAGGEFGELGELGEFEEADAAEPIEEASAASHRSSIRPASYINPDTGAATENPNVDPESSCEEPDRYDTQRLSDPGMANRNVHNDACLSRGSSRGCGRGDGQPFDGPASFESAGVGLINACPDPDGDGPKVARLVDRDGDGRADRCYQSGYQTKGTAGDQEYHARLNNSTQPGMQTVMFCYDPEDDGCANASDAKKITIVWGAGDDGDEWDSGHDRDDRDDDR